MPVSASTVWEIRTGGASTNGGGFVTGATGVDYSQQDGPQYNLTGVTSSGAGDTVLSASAAADMVGNIAQCTSGTNFTAGFYQVISVVVGVSITFSTNRSSTSITTGIGVLGAIKVGGALALPSNVTQQPTAGNTIFVKQGTYTVTVAQSFILTGTALLPINVVSYDTTRSIGASADTKALFTTATDTVAIFSPNNCQRTNFYNFRVTSTASSRGIGWAGVVASSNFLRWYNCEVDGCLNGWATPVVLANANFDNCVVKNCTGDGWMITTNTTNWKLFGCWSDSNAGSGLNISGINGVSAILVSCIFSDNGSDGIVAGVSSATTLQRLDITNCVFENNTGSGLHITGTSNFNPVDVQNNIFYGNGRYGIECDNAAVLTGNFQANAYGANSLGATLNFTESASAITLTADPFVDRANDDYRLNSTAGGGAALKGVAYPRQVGSNSVNAGANSADVGALQVASGGGGGGTTLILGG